MEEKYSYAEDWTGEIRLKLLGKIAVWRNKIFMVYIRRSKVNPATDKLQSKLVSRK